MLSLSSMTPPARIVQWIFVSHNDSSCFHRHLYHGCQLPTIVFRPIGEAWTAAPVHIVSGPLEYSRDSTPSRRQQLEFSIGFPVDDGTVERNPE